MKAKNTAHRPSQANQQYVLNARGEKVLNTAYNGGASTSQTAEDLKDSLNSDFSFEEELVIPEEKLSIQELVMGINGSSVPEKPTPQNLYIDDMLDVDLLDRYVSEGVVNARRHPEYPLTIYKYSDELMYSQKWDEVTLQCRGLIVEDSGRIVSRGFNKFFNLGEMPKFGIEVSPDEQCVIMPKEDGSLGIVYQYDGKYHISTAGSFTSDQAIHATKKLREMDLDLPAGVNPMVEIVYPENRIVTNYGDRDELILLGATNNFGHWMHPETLRDVWDGSIVDYKRGTVRDMLQSKDPEDTREGFVARLDNGLMVKMKYPYYLTLHKARFSLSYKSVLGMIQSGNFEEYRLSIPDEFSQELLEYKERIDARYNEIAQGIDTFAAKIPDGLSRKDAAIWVSQNVPATYRAYVMNWKVAGRSREDVFQKIYSSKQFSQE